MWYASEITGLPRDTFEVREITREEFEGFRAVVKCNQWRQLSRTVPLALFFRTRQRFGELVDNLSNAFVSPGQPLLATFWPLPHRREIAMFSRLQG
jgi:hypothetical protein